MSDGSVLSVVGITPEGRADFLYDRRRSRDLPPAYADDIDYTRRETEPRPQESDCVATTPLGRYSFSLLDPSDLARCADLVSEDTGLTVNDARAALSKCKSGGAVVFEQ